MHNFNIFFYSYTHIVIHTDGRGYYNNNDKQQHNNTTTNEQQMNNNNNNNNNNKHSLNGHYSMINWES